MAIPFPHMCKACLAKGEKNTLRHFVHMRNHYKKHHTPLPRRDYRKMHDETDELHNDEPFSASEENGDLSTDFDKR